MVAESNNNQVSRNWFIEVNPGADCFNEKVLNPGGFNERFSPDFEGTLLLEPNISFYAFIRHDKDIQEDGTLKPAHYHLVVKYKNNKTFQSVQKDFPGAHIERSQSVSSSVQYLTHQLQPEKAQYGCNLIITNRPDLLQVYLQVPQTEQFNQYDIWEYISIDRMFTYTDFCIRFGVDQVRKYRTDIQAMIREYIDSQNKSVLECLEETERNIKNSKKSKPKKTK